MKKTITAIITFVGVAVLLVSANIVAASIEPDTSTGTLSFGLQKSDRLDIPRPPKGDLLPVATSGSVRIYVAVAYRTGASLAVIY